MERTPTVKGMADFPARIRAVMPDATIRTTCLVGFPGETEDHFRHLLEYIEQVKFDHLGVFVFSPEENTPAALLPDRPAIAIAEERRDRLLLAQKKIVDEKAASLIGAKTDVLLDRKLDKEGRHWAGRTKRQAPEVDGMTEVKTSSKDHQRGDFVSAIYTGQSDYDMQAGEF
jgi:ribosomal protein S12 methylthiotransferase